MFETTAVLVLMLSSIAAQQVIPSQYATPQIVGVLSANGSSPTGNCSPNATSRHIELVIFEVTTCTAPASSVLFDGIIPTLTGLDGNMWASELLTLHAPNRAFINFDFSGAANYTGVDRVEVVIVNCPDMGIQVSDIYLTNITGLNSFNNTEIPGSRSAPMNISCDSLVTVNLFCECNPTFLGIEIHTSSSSNFVYIAEIRFCGDDECVSINTDNTSEHFTPINPTTPSASTSPTGMNNQTTGLAIDMNQKTNILPIILSVVGLLIIVCVVGVVLLLWRCYCAKHHQKSIKNVRGNKVNKIIKSHDYPMYETVDDVSSDPKMETAGNPTPSILDDTYTKLNPSTLDKAVGIYSQTGTTGNPTCSTQDDTYTKLDLSKLTTSVGIYSQAGTK